MNDASRRSLVILLGFVSMAAVIGIGLSIAGANTAPRNTSASNSLSSAAGDCAEESICIDRSLYDYVEPQCESTDTVKVFYCRPVDTASDPEADEGACIVDYEDFRIVSSRFYELDCSSFGN